MKDLKRNHLLSIILKNPRDNQTPYVAMTQIFSFYRYYFLFLLDKSRLTKYAISNEWIFSRWGSAMIVLKFIKVLPLFFFSVLALVLLVILMYIFIPQVLMWLVIIFLALLALMLLVISVLLFVPIRYYINLKYSGKQEVYLKASWLFRIFTFSYDNTVVHKSTLKVFNTSVSGRKLKDIQRLKEKKAYDLNKTVVDEDEAIDSDKASSDVGEQSTDWAKQLEEEDSSSDEKGSGLRENWDRFKSYPYKEMLVSNTILLLKRLLKPLKPKAASLKCCFGLDDPSATGALLGAAHAICGICGLYNNVSITADFDKKCLNYECYVEGKIKVWSLTWPFVVYSFSKLIWFFLRPLISSALQAAHHSCLQAILRCFRKLKLLIFQRHNKTKKQ